MTLSGQYYIDSLDLFDTFGIWVENGSDDFLKIPERKESISRTWLDEDGDDVDLSNTYFKAREVTLRFQCIQPSKALFFEKFGQFIALMKSSGSRRLTVSRHNRDYMVRYADNKSAASFNFFNQSTGDVLTKFALTFIESKPNLYGGAGSGGVDGGSGGNGSSGGSGGTGGLPAFIVDQAGKFLIS